jgi:opacity protein-like surface antigen
MAQYRRTRDASRLARFLFFWIPSFRVHFGVLVVSVICIHVDPVPRICFVIGDISNLLLGVFQMRMKLIVASLLLAATFPVSAQVVPAAEQHGLPLVVGVGFSDFNSDWNYGVRGGRLAGGTVWADWNFYGGPSFLHGLGIEAEARDLNYARTGNVPNLRQDTAEIGAIYTWRHYHRFHPYAKFLAGLGSIDFQHTNPHYAHDTRTVYAPGGGVEYRAWRNVWVRADYEYQYWPNFFWHETMEPNGVTIGVSYDFRHSHAQ